MDSASALHSAFYDARRPLFGRPGQVLHSTFPTLLRSPPPVASYYGIQPISPPARSRQTSPGEIYLEGRCFATADQQSADQGEPPSNPYGLLSREALGLFNFDVDKPPFEFLYDELSPFKLLLNTPFGNRRKQGRRREPK